MSLLSLRRPGPAVVTLLLLAALLVVGGRWSDSRAESAPAAVPSTQAVGKITLTDVVGTSDVSTTIPAFAQRELRLDGDQPFTTTSSDAVIDGQMIPPGHMQNE